MLKFDKPEELKPYFGDYDEFEEQEGFIDSEGLVWDHKWQYYAAKIGMCGCGNPDEAYGFIRNCLKLFDSKNEKRYEFNPHDEMEKLILSDPKIAVHALVHLLQDKCLEHGGSVYGAWLTDFGKTIVDFEPDFKE